MTQGRVNVEYGSLNDLVRIIQFERSGAPVALIQEYMRQAAEELAEACVATLDIELEGDPNVNEYDFSHCIPEGLEVAAVQQIIICGECIEPYEKCDRCPNGWQLTGPTCITIKPCPPDAITVCVVLRPTEACNQLPDCFARHRRFFHHYVSGRLALMESEEWGSAREARFHTRKAESLKKTSAVKETRNQHKSVKNNDGAGCLI